MTYPWWCTYGEVPILEELRYESFWKILLLAIATAYEQFVKTTSSTEAVVNLSMKLPLSTSLLEDLADVFRP